MCERNANTDRMLRYFETTENTCNRFGQECQSYLKEITTVINQGGRFRGKSEKRFEKSMVAAGNGPNIANQPDNNEPDSTTPFSLAALLTALCGDNC